MFVRYRVPDQVYIVTRGWRGMDQTDRWNDLYRSQTRAWRGVTDLGELPFDECARILEVGCGNGKTMAALIERGFRVTGVDFSSEAVDACRRILGNDADVRCASVLDLPFDDGEFDGATAFHVLENLDPGDVPKAVSELARVCKEGSFVKVRVFSAGDLRSDKGERVSDDTVVRGNGIRYRYFTEDSLRDCFDGHECVSIRSYSEATRFGGSRSRIEAVFRI